MKDTVILLIHGFMGHSNEFHILKAVFTSWEYDTYTFNLAGHEDKIIQNVTRKDWEADCISNIETLIKKGYKKIILVGHSMGGVLATMLASKYKDYVVKLILIDPAFEYLGMKNGKLKIISSVKQIVKILKDKASISNSKAIRRCSLASIREFTLLVKEHKEDIFIIECPVLFIHGANDYVVPIEKIKIIYDKIPNKNKES